MADPDHTGIVSSLNAVDHSDDGMPKFVFTLDKASPPVPGDAVLYVDYRREGALGIVYIVSAAFAAKEPLKVKLLLQFKNHVDWVQLGKRI